MDIKVFYRLPDGSRAVQNSPESLQQRLEGISHRDFFQSTVSRYSADKGAKFS